MTKDIYLNTYISKEQNDALLEDRSNFVVLTPDDILTLKLLRDEHRTLWFGRNEARRDVSRENVLETLERILKQVR